MSYYNYYQNLEDAMTASAHEHRFDFGLYDFYCNAAEQYKMLKESLTIEEAEQAVPVWKY